MRQLLRIILWLGMSVTLTASAEEPVHFLDPVLKSVVEETLGVIDPTPSDMLSLTRINYVGTFGAGHDDITQLSGLEYAENLTHLDLRLNAISNVSPLAGLINLVDIDLSQNNIRNADPIAGLVNLRSLNLHGNSITSLCPITELEALEDLIMRINKVSDLSPLEGLAQLRFVDFYYNEVSDVSPLAGHAELRTINLNNNRVSSLSPLKDLPDLTRLDIRYNLLRDLSPLKQLPSLSRLDLLHNEIQNIFPLTELPNLSSVNLEQNPLGPEAYETDLALLRQRGVNFSYSPTNRPPTDVTASLNECQDHVLIEWEEVANGPSYSSYYRVSRSPLDESVRTSISDWSTSLSHQDGTVEPGRIYQYWVQTAVDKLGSNAGPYSEPVSGSIPAPVVTISSASGGEVTTSPDIASVEIEQTSQVTGTPLDPNLYSFLKSTGSAVDGFSDLEVTASTIIAVASEGVNPSDLFVSHQPVLYVDDDANNDPVPGDATSSDPNELGTLAHPFDSIQEAIEAADANTVILVGEGRYRERIDFLGKPISVEGVGFPVIEGVEPGPLVSFTQQEDSNSVLHGFTLTRGQDIVASAVYCLSSSPTLSNCLIVGNRITDDQGEGAAIYCVDSRASFLNCTIADNIGGQNGGGLTLVGSDVILSNAIVWNNTPAQIVSQTSGLSALSYTDLLGASSYPGLQDAKGILDVDPVFAKPGHWRSLEDETLQWEPGDYHLTSKQGRWDSGQGTWRIDCIASPCIDSGDPALGVGHETVPHGGRINLGAYGATAEASRSFN